MMHLFNNIITMKMLYEGDISTSCIPLINTEVVPLQLKIGSLPLIP